MVKINGSNVEISSSKNNNPFGWILFCIFLFILSGGLAGIALLATKLPPLMLDPDSR